MKTINFILFSAYSIHSLTHTKHVRLISCTTHTLLLIISYNVLFPYAKKGKTFSKSFVFSICLKLETLCTYVLYILIIFNMYYKIHTLIMQISHNLKFTSNTKDRSKVLPQFYYCLCQKVWIVYGNKRSWVENLLSIKKVYSKVVRLLLMFLDH